MISDHLIDGYGGDGHRVLGCLMVNGLPGIAPDGFDLDSADVGGGGGVDWRDGVQIVMAEIEPQAVEGIWVHFDADAFGNWESRINQGENKPTGIGSEIKNTERSRVVDVLIIAGIHVRTQAITNAVMIVRTVIDDKGEIPLFKREQGKVSLQDPLKQDEWPVVKTQI